MVGFRSRVEPDSCLTVIQILMFADDPLVAGVF